MAHVHSNGNTNFTSMTASEEKCVKEFFALGPPKTIATDVDGTLLTPDHNLTERTVQALLLAKQKGVNVIIATGKLRPSIKEVLNRLGANQNDYSINVSGALVYNGSGQIVLEETLPLSAVGDVIGWCSERKIAFGLFCGEKILAREKNELTEILLDFHEPPAEIMPNLSDDIETGHWKVNKIVLMVEVRDVPRINAQLSELVQSYPVQITSAIPYLIELMPAGVSKATALEKVCQWTHTDIERVMSFGDGDNDVEMLRASGLGVAMANGSAAVKEAADVVTKSNAEDGLANFIENYIV